MFTNILIATDGSELAGRAVSHGVSLAKLAGSKVTALIVEPSFNVFGVPESQVRQMPEAFAKHTEHIKQHATKVLNHVAGVAKTAGVSCETVQLEHVEAGQVPGGDDHLHAPAERLHHWACHR